MDNNSERSSALPCYLIVSGHLQSIISALWAAVMREPEGESKALEAWYQLRKVEERLVLRRSCVGMPAADRELMLNCFRAVPESASTRERMAQICLHLNTAVPDAA